MVVLPPNMLFPNEVSIAGRWEIGGKVLKRRWRGCAKPGASVGWQRWAKKYPAWDAEPSWIAHGLHYGPLQNFPWSNIPQANRIIVNWPGTSGQSRRQLSVAFRELQEPSRNP